MDLFEYQAKHLFGEHGVPVVPGEVVTTPEQAAEELRQGEPAIEVRPNPSEGLEVAVWMLAAGEDRIVGQRVRSVLAAALRRAG